jgi:C-terminal processing protease CtpA/Prc
VSLPLVFARPASRALAILIATISVAFYAAPAPADAPTPAAGALTAEQASLDVRVLKRVLLALHPGLTKYQTEAEWQANLARFEARGNAARSATEMFLAASELAASIRCGHTWTNIRNQVGAARLAIYDAPNKLPLHMTWVEGRWLVLASATAEVRRGDEITHVNGIAASDMVAMMWPYLRADGSSDTKRFRQLGHDRVDMSQLDITWPLLSPPQDGTYSFWGKRDGKAYEARVTAMTLKAREAGLAAIGVKPIDEAWSLEMQRDGDGKGEGKGRATHAVMPLPTFAFWNSKFDWQAFLAKSFAQLNTERVPHLIIDIRDNEGGDGAIGATIVSYLLKSPFRYQSDQSITVYERVPYVLVRYLDTWDYSFFDRTGKVRPVTSGPQSGKLEVIERAAGTRLVEPVEQPYQGKVVILVGGENSSATFQFAWLAQQAKVATLVGQATGGNLRGLTGGELTWVRLPNSGVAVDVPLLATRYASDTPDQSVIPEVLVERRFAARRAGVDEEMQAAMRLVPR